MGVYREIAKNGLWNQNPVLGQMLGLCSLLAISSTTVNAVSLGIATILVMAMANLIISALRSFIPYEIRIPVFILIIASLVTVVDMSFNAWLHELYLILGIFIPLIVVNCIVLARVEAFAAKNSVLASTWDGVVMGVGFVWVIGLLGGVREFIAQGTILSGIEMIIPGTHGIQVLPENYPGFLVAILPPGAFFFLGLMVALRNWTEARANERAKARLRQQMPTTA
ncbi:MAG: electron transport complex subunit E [Rhodocyclaceae bacterium]|nr:electron transport complex subunit E [Rhodocyclaceae bacterium]